MRRELIEEMLKEVLGPREGPEEMVPWDPQKEYITGVIRSRHCRDEVHTPDSEITVMRGGDASAEDDVHDEGTITMSTSDLDPRVRPSSFGISFTVKSENPSFRVCVTWGRYFVIGKNNDGRTIWQRKPFYWIGKIVLDEDRKRIPIYREGNGGIFLDIRKEVNSSENLSTVILTVVNELPVGETGCRRNRITETSLFQPSIRVLLDQPLHGTQMISGKTSGTLEFLYRDRPIYARGFMCSAVWDEIDYVDFIDNRVLWADGAYFPECGEFTRPHIRSEFVPLYPVPSPDFSWPEDLPEPVFSTFRLSEMWSGEEIDEFLGPLVEGYRTWIKNNERNLTRFIGEDRRIAEELIKKQKKALKRMEIGVELLKNDIDVRVSFCFANRVIWLQYYCKNRKQEDFRWRPFQLAFILQNLESIANETSEYRDVTDLLWAPTGGGKTEAYLGLMAFAMALRRRRARTSRTGDITGGGTSIISRYTLRLLTVQQFRRILAMVTAAEYLRVYRMNDRTGWRPEKCDFDDDWIYGTLRFSAGLWVGGKVTPNRLRGRGQAIDILKGGTGDGEPAQVLKCPACGSWLAVPRGGLPAKSENTLHLIVKTSRKPDRLRDELLSIVNELQHVRDIRVSDRNLKPGFCTVSLIFYSSKKLRDKDIDEIWAEIERLAGIELQSLRASRPGYFGYGKEPGRRKEEPVDFEIFCTNPECPLGSDVIHGEGVPVNTESGITGEEERLPDGLVLRRQDFPFMPGSRIPIPAYTVDEQIYSRCPTVIVSTADKIARLAYEPRAASIFGNVSLYNPYYGYLRNEDLYPHDTTRTARRLSVRVEPFNPPDLIVQDELHLMDGPLGSMFGLYENVVDILIRENGRVPKRIASTATIRRAERQVRNLFAGDVFQFPPHGLKIEDSFFIRHPSPQDGWDENRPGRIYMGLFSTGLGPLTPLVRIWSRLLKETHDRRHDRNAIYYWTVTGYFNAIRELGGGVGLYREDIVERLGEISGGYPRSLGPERVVELSSRVDSTDIPQILDELETGESRTPEENPDAIFTTSMFGTGVDIPHLSLMIVHGQPKTTSQYIQATGRIGRKHGGLVITFLRAGRPRDLSHYEMFTAYHHRIYLEVEPPSVSPFSDGTLNRAAGSSMVAFLRNKRDPSVEWYDDKNGRVILQDGASRDTSYFLTELGRRVGRIYSHPQEVIRHFKSQIDRWEIVANRVGERDFVFVEYPHRGVKKSVVLGTPAHARARNRKRIEIVFDNAPQSLREVEETIGLEV